jgi:thioredoxin-related protein
MTDEVTLADAEVKKALARFVKVRLDSDRDRQAASDYGVRGLPDFIVTDSSGKEVAGNSGFLPPQQFLVFINDIAAYVEARRTLAGDPKNADAAFAAASRCAASASGSFLETVTVRLMKSVTLFR